MSGSRSGGVAGGSNHPAISGPPYAVPLGTIVSSGPAVPFAFDAGGLLAQTGDSLRRQLAEKAAVDAKGHLRLLLLGDNRARATLDPLLGLRR